MIDVTVQAKELLRAVDVREQGVLRLDPLEGGEIGFVSGPALADDQVVQDEGQPLLHIAAPLAEQFDGQELDRVDGPQGPQLALTPPGNQPEATSV